jgi:hypothetical protein
MRAGPNSEQWECGCGWSNFAVRKRCRNCGEPSLAERIAAQAREIESQVDLSHWRKYQPKR